MQMGREENVKKMAAGEGRRAHSWKCVGRLLGRGGLGRFMPDELSKEYNTEGAAFKLVSIY